MLLLSITIVSSFSLLSDIPLWDYPFYNSQCAYHIPFIYPFYNSNFSFIYFSTTSIHQKMGHGITCTFLVNHFNSFRIVLFTLYVAFSVKSGKEEERHLFHSCYILGALRRYLI